MKVTFDHSQPAAKNLVSFYFSKPEGLRYIAGQFIELYLPHDNPDSHGERHWFTLSSSPSEDHLAITTKIIEPISSFKSTLLKLKPGVEVNLADPMGDFVLPKDPSIPLVFIAGGIGCTPFRSIIKYLIDSGEKRNIKLIYLAASNAEVAFDDVFSELGDKFIKIIGAQADARQIFKYFDDASGYAYISGPEPMVEQLRDGLVDLGVDRQAIYTDFFHNYVNF